MKNIWLVSWTIALLLAGCSTAAPTTVSTERIAEPMPRTLNVFAAASLTDAFGEISQAFEAANPGVTVKLNFAGSQSLRTQIEQGAQVDVFASANSKEMDALVTGKFVAETSAQFFLTNELVVILPTGNPAGIKELVGLSKSGIKIILAAKEVPVGNYSLQTLDKLDAALGAEYKDQVLANVVSYENDVKLVVAKVQLGEADAGIVYVSDAVAAPDLVKLEISDENNVIAKYPLAALSQSTNPALAQEFITFVLSPVGQAVLQKWGFSPVK